MEVAEIRELVRRPSWRPIRMGAAACLLLAAPIAWSVWQSRMTREAIDRAAAAERAASRANDVAEQARAEAQGGGRPPKDRAVRRSRHDDPAEIARVRQLNEEIESLTRIQDRIEESLRAEKPFVPKQAPAPK